MTEKISKKISAILENADFIKIINGDSFFKNSYSCDSSGLSNELKTHICKYILLFSIHTRLKDGTPVIIKSKNPKKSKPNLKYKQTIPPIQISQAYGWWLNNIEEQLTKTQKKEDLDTKETKEISDELELKDPQTLKKEKLNAHMAKVRNKLEYSPLLNQFSFSITQHDKRKSFIVVPHSILIQILMLHNINEEPYNRLSIETDNKLWRESIQDKELYPLIASLENLKRNPANQQLNHNDFLYNVNNDLTTHKQNLSKIIPRVEDYVRKINKFLRSKANYQKDLKNNAEKILKNWMNLESYLKNELFEFNQLTEKDLTEIQIKDNWDFWGDKDITRSNLVSKCINKNSQNSLLDILEKEARPSTYNAGGLTANNIQRFLKNIISQFEQSVTILKRSKEKNKFITSSLRFSKLEETNLISMFLFEQIYAAETTETIINIYNDISISKRLSFSLLSALSKSIMIPDVFARSYYLNIAHRIYNNHYEISKEIRNSKSTEWVVPSFNEDQWIDDCSDYFQHLATNFYPKLHNLCREIICNDPEISTKELVNYFRAITNTQDPKTQKTILYEDQKINELKKSIKKISKYKNILVQIYENYYDLFYNRRTLDKFTLITSDPINNEELQDVIRIALEEYRRNAMLGLSDMVHFDKINGK